MDSHPIPDPDEYEGRVAKTTVTSFRVIEALEAAGTAGVSELAEELSLGKATVHKHVSTLRRIGYVVREENGRYHLSLAFLGLGASVRARTDLYGEIHGPLRKLAEATGEVASVMVPEHDRGVYLARVTVGDHPPFEPREGEQVPLTATAGGKAILSYLPADERRRVLDERGLSALTEHTITDRETLRKELQGIRDKRIAYDRGELEPDRHCMAAPVTDGDDTAIAAVTVSGPAERMDAKAEQVDISSILGSTANAIRNRVTD